MPSFGKYKGKAFSVQFSKTEQAIIDREITKQLIEHMRQNEIDLESNVLWILHKYYGFGEKRLHDLFRKVWQENMDLTAYYETETSDGCWICRKLLKDSGIDVEKWYREECGDEEI